MTALRIRSFGQEKKNFSFGCPTGYQLVSPQNFCQFTHSVLGRSSVPAVPTHPLHRPASCHGRIKLTAQQPAPQRKEELAEGGTAWSQRKSVVTINDPAGAMEGGSGKRKSTTLPGIGHVAGAVLPDLTKLSEGSPCPQRSYKHVTTQWDTGQRGTGTNKMPIVRDNYFSPRGKEEGGGPRISDPFRER